VKSATSGVAGAVEHNGATGPGEHNGAVGPGEVHGLSSDVEQTARIPVPSSASATCAGCGAPLAPDQRYCLACGRPASPVRLAFLDVLQSEYRPAAAAAAAGGPPGAGEAVGIAAGSADGQVLGATPLYAGYPPPEPAGLLGALRRYTGLFALLGVLLASLLIGLLVGHWATGGGGGTPGKQVVEVKGLGGLVAAAPGVATTAGAGANGSGSTGSTGAGASKTQKNTPASEKTQEASEAKEAQSAKAPPPVQKKVTSSTLQKLSTTTGKKHEQEVNKAIQGDAPIETH
jgi:hypothetical protein